MRVLSFSGQEFCYRWWRDEQLKGTVECPLAYDSETQAIPPYRPPLPGEDPLSLPNSTLVVPEVAVGLAYDGKTLVLIHPSRLKAFVAKHRTQQVVGQHVSFDYWVLMKFARDRKDKLMEEFLWQWAEANKFCDTGVLDMLLQLGSGKYRFGGNKSGEDVKLFMGGLGVLSEEWGCGELDKTDPYRLRFQEWIGKSEEEIEAHPEFEGFASYALKDVIVTWRLYPKMREAAIKIMKKAGWTDNPNQKTYEIRPDALRLFGPLSEFLQVKGAIALEELSRTPLYINQEKRAELEAGTRERYQKCMDRLVEMEPALFKRYSPKARGGKAGQLRLNPKTGLPSMDYGILKGRLLAVAAELGIEPPISKGKKADTSLSIKDWAPIADQVDDDSKESVQFLKAWCGMGAEIKLLSFFLSLNSEDGKAYSSYNLLMRTGRTSAQAHKKDGILLAPSCNIQQLPREDSKHPERSVRSLFYPPPGHNWYSIDYSYIELRSLAAVCKARFGWSKLAEVIEAHTKYGGIDPHQRTAAMIMGLTPEQFLMLLPEQQEKGRQTAKAVNFWPSRWTRGLHIPLLCKNSVRSQPHTQAGQRCQETVVGVVPRTEALSF